ncbi:MAG: MFS transporter [Bacillota bacterium]
MQEALEKIEKQIQPYVKRNVMTSYADGMFDAVALGMVPVQTVMVYFISGYVASNFSIGLLSSMHLLLSVLPQFFVARQLERKGYFKRQLALWVIPARTAFLVLGLLIMFVAPKNERAFVFLFYAVYWLHGLLMGGVALSWFNYINKIIPFKARGRFFGVRGSINGLAGIAGSFLGGLILASKLGKIKYGYMFIAAFLLDMFSVAFQLCGYEPKTEANSGQTQNSGTYGTKLLWIIKNDGNFVRYVIMDAIVVFVLSTLAFQTVYAKEAFRIGGKILFVMTAAMFVSETCGNLLWGFLADKYAFKVSMFIGYSMYLANLMLAVSVNYPAVIVALTFIYGLSVSVQRVISKNFLFNICSYDNRPSYMCLANMAVIPVAGLAPLLNGFIYDIWGFKAMCWINLALLITAISMFPKIKESIQI